MADPKNLNIYNDSITQRIVNVVNTYKDETGVYKRVVLNDITISYVLDQGKPILTMDEALLTRMTVITNEYPKETKLDNIGYRTFITDEAYLARNDEERFVFMGRVEHPIAKTHIMFAYDKLFKDIIVVPTVDCFYNEDGFLRSKQMITVQGSIVGLQREQDNDTSLNEKIPVTPRYHMDIDECSENFITTAIVTMIPGSDPDTAFKDTNIIDKLGITGSYVLRGETRPMVFVKLGKKSDIFNMAKGDRHKLPVYSVYDYSPTRFQMTQIGYVDTKERDLYVAFAL